MFRYQTVAKQLQAHLEDGQFPDGRLPSERALMERYEVNRSTIRKALAAMQSAGLIRIERNRRPFVVGEASRIERTESAFEKGPAASGNIVLSVQTIRESTARFDIEDGLSGVLQRSGYGLVYHDPARAAATDSGLPDEDFFAANEAAGVAIWARTTAKAKDLQRLSRQVPLVLVDRQVAGFDSDFVGFDDEAGGRLATEHLLSLGHRRIGFLSSDAGAETVNGRWRGYRAALIDAGIAPLHEQTLHLNGLPTLPDIMAHSYLERFIRQTGKPLTAVVCTTDGAAATLIAFLRASGRSIPGDVAVTGYGDLLPHIWRAIELTTVRQSFVDVGGRAGEILLERLSDRSGPSSHIEVHLPVQLIVRGSCGGKPSGS